MNTVDRSYELFVSLGWAVGLTALSYAAAMGFGWLDPTTGFPWIEAAGVALNYACVFLTARQNIWNWPLGIAAVVLLGYLFWQWGLYASLVLHIGYFLPIQFVGWYI